MDTCDSLSSICSPALGIKASADVVPGRVGFPYGCWRERERAACRKVTPKSVQSESQQIWLKPKISCWVWTEQCISQATIPPSHAVPGHLRFPMSVFLSPWQFRLKNWKAFAAVVGFCVWLTLLPCKPDAAAAAAQLLGHYNPTCITVMPLELLIWQNLDPNGG